MVVTGTVENPDVGDIRRLRVLVEAFDEGGWQDLLRESVKFVNP